MGPDKKSSERFASRTCVSNKPPMSIVKAMTRISRRHEKAIGRPCPALSDMPYDQIRKLDNKLRKMQKAYVLASSASDAPGAPPPSHDENCASDRLPATNLAAEEIQATDENRVSDRPPQSTRTSLQRKSRRCFASKTESGAVR
jgi:hypothetical protein